MTVEPTPAPQTPAPQTPAPPVPTPPDPTPPTPTPPESYDFPGETPISEMTEAQKAEYWKHKARKWESNAKDRGDYDDLKAELESLRSEKLSEAEKAVSEARKEGETSATQKMGLKLASAQLWGALRGQGLDDAGIESKLAYLDFQAFLDDNGEVDSDKVNNYLKGFSAPEDPKTPSWPDMGGGKRSSLDDKKTGGSVTAGRELHASLRENSQ